MKYHIQHVFTTNILTLNCNASRLQNNEKTIKYTFKCQVESLIIIKMKLIIPCEMKCG